MNIINIIEKKRDKKLLNKNEIDFFIKGILDWLRKHNEKLEY